MNFVKASIVIVIVFVVGGLFLFYPRETTQTVSPSPTTSSMQLIEGFYQDYLSATPESRKAMNLPFSADFQNLIKRNSQVCQEKADEDICGWASDGDIYLNTQDVEPELAFENSNFRISSPQPDIVDVEMSINPSLKTNSEFSRRSFRFLLKQEDSKWVVDDIIQNGISARKLIEEEIEFYLKQESEME